MPPIKGCSLSASHKAAISKGLKGKPKSEKHKQAIRRGMIRHYARRELTKSA